MCQEWHVLPCRLSLHPQQRLVRSWWHPKSANGLQVKHIHTSYSWNRMPTRVLHVSWECFIWQEHLADLIVLRVVPGTWYKNWTSNSKIVVSFWDWVFTGSELYRTIDGTFIQYVLHLINRLWLWLSPTNFQFSTTVNSQQSSHTCHMSHVTSVEIRN